MKETRTLKTSVIYSAIKQVCSVLFPLITIPYVTRVVGPDSYGKYNFSTSIISYFAYIATFGISTYAIRECSKVKNDRKQLNNLFSQLIKINLITTTISYFLLFAGLLVSQKLQQYSTLILIYSLTMIFTTIGADWVNVVFEEYKFIAIRYGFFQLVSLLLLFLFVKKPSDILIYCAISVFAGVGGNLANIVYIRSRVSFDYRAKIEYEKHIRPLFVFFVSSIGILIYVNSDVTMIGLFLKDTDVGVYGFCSKLYGIIKTLIYSIISTSAARMAYLVKNDQNKYAQYMDKIFTIIGLVLLPICVGVVGLRKDIIEIVGGSQYLVGSTTLSILMGALPFAIMCSYYSSLILIVHNQEKIMLLSTIISSATNILLNLFFIPRFGINGAAITTVIAEFISFTIAIMYARKFYSYQKLNYKVYYCVAIECLVIIGLIYGFDALINADNTIMKIVKVAIVVIVSGLSYIIILLNSKNTSVRGIIIPEIEKVRTIICRRR